MAAWIGFLPPGVSYNDSPDPDQPRPEDKGGK